MRRIREEAHLFIDFLLRPDIAARNTKVTNFANGVAASRPLVDKEIAENPAIYPDAADDEEAVHRDGSRSADPEDRHARMDAGENRALIGRS